MVLFGSLTPANATVTAPTSVSDNALYSVSGAAPAGATYAAIAWCNISAGVTPGTACNGAGSNSSALVAVSSGTYTGNIRPQDSFANIAFGGLTPAAGSTNCRTTQGSAQCGWVVSYYSGTISALVHLTGADETLAANF